MQFHFRSYSASENNFTLWDHECILAVITLSQTMIEKKWIRRMNANKYTQIK